MGKLTRGGLVRQYTVLTCCSWFGEEIDLHITPLYLPPLVGWHWYWSPPPPFILEEPEQVLAVLARTVRSQATPGME